MTIISIVAKHQFCAVLGIISLLFVLIANINLHLAKKYDDHKLATLKSRLSNMYNDIKNTDFLYLPKLSISYYLNLKSFLNDCMDMYIDFIKYYLGNTGYIVLVLFGCIASVYLYKSTNLLDNQFITINLAIVILILSLWICTYLIRRSTVIYINPGDFDFEVLAFLITVIAYPTLWIIFLLNLPVVISAVLFVLTSPILLYATCEVMHFLRVTYFQGFWLTVSAVLTMLCLAIGYILSPSAPLPQTSQMLISNILCDGLTLLATAVFLSWLKENYSLLRFILVAVADISVAAVLAVASLYFGICTIREITFIDISFLNKLYIAMQSLIGLSTDGSVFQIGPYFTTMHTVFLPSICYLLILSSFWLIKYGAIPIANHLKAASESPNPLEYSGTYFNIIASVIAVIAATIYFI